MPLAPSWQFWYHNNWPRYCYDGCVSGVLDKKQPCNAIRRPLPRRSERERQLPSVVSCFATAALGHFSPTTIIVARTQHITSAARPHLLLRDLGDIVFGCSHLERSRPRGLQGLAGRLAFCSFALLIRPDNCLPCITDYKIFAIIK